MRLENLSPGLAMKDILPNCAMTLAGVNWFGLAAVDITYTDPSGRLRNQFIYSNSEATLELVDNEKPRSFNGDRHSFRLVSEAQRIRIAHLFDSLFVVHTSLIDPSLHQIPAGHDALLPRLPLRFLLVDDPGPGKTAMSGSLIKELIARGDLQRCLIVCPGSLAEQWQDELRQRFCLAFEILTSDKLEAASSGNWFFENNLVIARLNRPSTKPCIADANDSNRG
jgi:SNF2 family DNA or RNA helicase